ncbi:jg25972 [Pararge aegeria aegeria]|uniref:Jg25972 protein n=1 Tax=Pararge aegeria aegeria TaxID=348720 RepID=A0A8S4RBZ4_9NEOP|nr:jg25972 [Pararge aegeria aegeria]
MRRLCCCGGAAPVQPSPKTPDLVADLPPLDRVTTDIIIGEEEKKPEGDEKEIEGHFTVAATTEIESKADERPTNIPPLSRTPSIHVENISENAKSINGDDLSEKSIHVENLSEKNISLGSVETIAEQISIESANAPSASSRQSQVTSEGIKTPTPKPTSAKSLSLSNLSKSAGKSISSTSMRSEPASPEPKSEYIESRSCERDVRTALTECMIPARHEDWEVIVNGLLETERLAKDEWARAPASSWRAVTRSVAGHVRSLRSRVARTACSTLGTLFEFRGRGLDPELEEAVSALLDRCADVNRFLRADAVAALGRVACGGNYTRAAVALARRGASHRGGPVRAAAAQALTRLVQQHGAVRMLELPAEPRTVILRAAGELIADASPEARMHARHLYIALSEDSRFRQLLKEAMPVSRYRAIEKYVDKLRCR